MSETLQSATNWKSNVNQFTVRL